MPFPVSQSVSRPVSELWPDERVIRVLRLKLRNLGAVVAEEGPRRLTFDVPWTVASSGPLFMVSRGECTIAAATGTADRRVLHCQLSFRRAALTAVIGSYGFLGPAPLYLARRADTASVLFSLGFATFAFFWLFGTWYMVAPFRFARGLDLKRFARAPGRAKS